MNKAFRRFVWINEGRHGKIILIFCILYFLVFSHRLSPVFPLRSLFLCGDISSSFGGESEFYRKGRKKEKDRK